MNITEVIVMPIKKPKPLNNFFRVEISGPSFLASLVTLVVSATLIPKKM
jgi:hypothetical protein